MFDFVIIGAGVVGGMLARELTGYTNSLCILEKGSDVSLGATRANSAIVHAGFDAKEGSLKALLNVRGSKMMANVCIFFTHEKSNQVFRQWPSMKQFCDPDLYILWLYHLLGSRGPLLDPLLSGKEREHQEWEECMSQA